MKITERNAMTAAHLVMSQGRKAAARLTTRVTAHVIPRQDSTDPVE